MNHEVAALLVVVIVGAGAIADDLPHTVDLRPRWSELGLTPKSQAPRGTCSVFAMVGLLEYELGRAAGRGVRLSEEFLNWASHQTNGRTSDGSFFADALRGIWRYGVCEEALLPYSPSFDPELQPSEAALQDAESRKSIAGLWIKEWDVTSGMSAAMLARIRESLADGHPVALGMRWPKNEQYDEDDLLVVPPPDGVFDGHSVVLVGYADDPAVPGGGAFIFRNSFGPDWRDGGHARLPYAYAAAYGNDALGLRVGTQ